MHAFLCARVCIEIGMELCIDAAAWALKVQWSAHPFAILLSPLMIAISFVDNKNPINAHMTVSRLMEIQCMTYCKRHRLLVI